MAEIRHLDNRHDVIFFCRGWFDLDKITETGASYDMTRCYNIATRNKKKQVGHWPVQDWYIFGSPGGTPRAIATKMRDAVYVRDRPPAPSVHNISAKSIGQFQEMRLEQRDRQTDKPQT